MNVWRIVIVAILGIGIAGCSSGRSETLVIATTWNKTERADFEKVFHDWSASKPSRLRWISLAPGDDFEISSSRSDPPDLLLGVSSQTLRRLLSAKKLDATGSPWWVARRRNLASASRSRVDESLAFDDFRQDPISMTWAESILQEKGWAEGYGELVGNGDVSRSPGRQPLSAFAALERNDVGSALAIVSPSVDAKHRTWIYTDSLASWDEGIAAVEGSKGQATARDFLRELARLGKIGPPPPEEIARSSAGETLLADLLGATLVDAQDDLRIASDALRRSPNADRANRWMREAPPWPPASVEKLLKSQNGMALAETLAAQIAPGPTTRAWLIRSWLSPSRLIDAEFLDSLGAADDGKLFREPRFRTWLRSEWTAWARQRYRRVARLADLGVPAS